LAQPEQAVGALNILTTSERKQILDFNEEYPGDNRIRTLVEGFEDQVKRTPERVALVCGDARLTYQELNARSNQLAHHLIRKGVEPGTLVGLYAERSVEMVVGVIGILKTGGAYVPLETTTPSERLSYMVSDARLSVLVTAAELSVELSDRGPQIVRVSSEWNRHFSEDDENPARNLSSDQPAYVIYTSGSTGQPKGVVVTHANVARLFGVTQRSFQFGPDDVWALFHSIAFDFSVWELWGALLYGGSLVVVPHWVSRSPEAFLSLLATEGVTVLNQTPSAFRQLIEAERLLDHEPNLQLRLVIFGGEALDVLSLKPWWERYGDETPRLVNMYGITETTVHVTYRPLSMNDLAHRGSVIGHPLADLHIYILDRRMQPVPIGVIGEIYVEGAGLAAGYLNRPDLTAERFPPNPFAKRPGERLYRSGDLARYRANGDIEYAGRADHQVKVRGFRIELGEIEAVLSAHPAVRETIALARGDEGRSTSIVAHVVPHQGIAITTAELRSHLKARLPEYMVPSAIFIQDEALPLTSNGKIDRRALSGVSSAPAGSEEPHIGPENEIECIIAEAWQRALGLNTVGIHDNFFDIGGNSVTVVQIYNQLKKEIHAEFTVVDLFQYATIRALSEHLKEGQDRRPALSSDIDSRIRQRITSGKTRNIGRKQV
jgi:amino acid adenylation domain-containing protein